ncbi:MAG: hypothetical protein ABI585_06395 [Betaproteobacteria bacterium]
MAATNERLDEMQMDVSSLCREAIFTDRRFGTIRVLVPVDASGNDDPKRATVYAGEAQIMTQVGALPISFEIEARTIAEAVAGYGAAAKAALDRTMKEIADMRRQQQTGLVIPQAGGGGLPGMGGLGGMPGGGMPGGKIQLP